MLDCIYDATLTSPPPPGNPKAFDCCVYPGEDGIFEPYLGGQGLVFKPNKRFLLEEFEGRVCFHERKTIFTSYNDAYKK